MPGKTGSLDRIHPSTPGVPLNLQTRPNTITILRTSDYSQFIRPPTREDPIREDFVLTGIIVVHLDSARLARELRLQFVAEVRLSHPG
jgi:hypothetical protein